MSHKTLERGRVRGWPGEGRQAGKKEGRKEGRRGEDEIDRAAKSTVANFGGAERREAESECAEGGSGNR